MDIFAKLNEEAMKLTGKNMTELDTEFLVDLLFEMSNDFKDTVIAWLATNIEHRLKIQYSSNPNPKNGWVVTVNRTILDLNRKFRRNHSLEVWLQGNIKEAFNDGVASYNIARQQYGDLPELPKDLTNPWSFEELMTPIDI